MGGNTLVAEIKDGKYKGETVEIDFGEQAYDTEVRINGKKALNIRSFDIHVEVDEVPRIEFDMYAEPLVEDDD